MRIGVLLDRSHCAHILLVEGAGDQLSEGPHESRHGDVEDQPTDDLRSAVVGLEGVMDVQAPSGTLPQASALTAARRQSL